MTYADEIIKLCQWQQKEMAEIKNRWETIYKDFRGLDGPSSLEMKKLNKETLKRKRALVEKYKGRITEEDMERIRNFLAKYRKKESIK